MGLKFVNKGSVIVDCRSAMRNGKSWTLVNNSSMERIYCTSGRDAMGRLRDTCIEVQQYLDELGKDGKQEKDDGYSERICFVSVDDAPAFLNLLDASDHVVTWKATQEVMLSRGERGIVRIDYKSDRQLLFQEGDKVVFRDEEPATPVPEGEKA